MNSIQLDEFYSTLKDFQFLAFFFLLNLNNVHYFVKNEHHFTVQNLAESVMPYF